MEAMGAKHIDTPPTGVVVDKKQRFVTTPCYMSATRVSEIADGTDAAVRELMTLLESPVGAN
jgi:enhancing lycopene biosynthesis protein 2